MDYNPEATCEHCRFFDNTKKGHECRRFPPQFPAGVRMWVFPSIKANSKACGEYVYHVSIGGVTLSDEGIETLAEQKRAERQAIHVNESEATDSEKTDESDSGNEQGTGNETQTQE